MSQPALKEADFLAAMPDDVAGYLAGTAVLQRLNQASIYAADHGHDHMRNKLRRTIRKVHADYLAAFEKDAEREAEEP